MIKIKMKRLLKRFVSMTLSVSMLTAMIQVPAKAAAVDVHIPEMEIDEEILSSDVFYLTAANAQLDEGANARYLLRLVRGGDCSTDAGVTVKIADLTASYGKDYTISLYGSDVKVDNPKNNQSLLERMEGESYTEAELRTESEYAEMIEQDDELRSQTADAVQDAINYIEQQSGIVENEPADAGEKAPEGETTPEEESVPEGELTSDVKSAPEGEPVPAGETVPESESTSEDEPTLASESASEGEPTPASEPTPEGEPAPKGEPTPEGEPTPANEPAPASKPASTGDAVLAEEANTDETVSTNPLQEARRMYTGVSGEPQRVTSTTDTMQQIQQMANVITSAVVGATLTVDFAAGESEKYIAIDVKDNHSGDGDRYFYLMLAAPYGTTTNSAASSCAVTIIDDEKQSPSRIQFSESAYTATGESVTVEIERVGALNTIAAAHLTAEGGKAQIGRDFSPIDMELVFPIGIGRRTIEIPIRTEYLVGSADFTLKLEDIDSCTIAQESAVVYIAGTAGTSSGTAAQAEENGVQLMAIEQSARVSDIELGNAIDLSSPVKKGNNDHFSGKNYYDSNGKWWTTKWKDNSFWYNYSGTVGASWTLTGNSGYDIGGVQIEWEHQGGDANIEAAFVNSSNRDKEWSFYNYAKNGKGAPYSSRAGFGRTKTNILSDIERPVRISVFNQANCDDCNYLWIYSIKPIYRPFAVNLQEATPLTFLNANGTRSAWKDATFLALAGANNTTNNQIIRYSKDGKNAVTFQQTPGKNVSAPYVYLKNVNIVKDNSSKSVASYGNDGKTSHTLTMDSTWINDNSGYIHFETNNSLDAWKNQVGSYGLRGRIELKPEFGYRDAKVKINVPANNFGYFRISGENKDISSQQTFTYHRGDILKLSTVMRDQYKDMYEPAGYLVSYKQNESETDWIKRDVKVPYSKDGGTSNFLDDNERLRYGYYEITPLFQRTGNAITVRVKKSELSKFDTTYGFFKTSMSSEQTVNGTVYQEYVVYNKPIYGNIYALTARLADSAGSKAYQNWTEPGSSRNYGGEVFYHEASNSAANNIITLSCVNEPTADVYQSVKGSVFRETYNMQTRQTGESNMLPAQGAIVSFGGAFSVIGEDGSFETAPFRAMNDSNGSSIKHYIRYVISSNGEDSLRELALQQTGGSYREVSVIKNDSGGNSISKANVWVNRQNVGQQMINTENGSVINNIDVYTDNTSYGNNLIIDGDSVTVRAKMREPAKYTKVIADADGNLTEYPDTDETVTGVKFVIYDACTNTKKRLMPQRKRTANLSRTFRFHRPCQVTGCI